VPNWELLRDHFVKEGKVTREDCLKIVRDCTQVFKKEPNLLSVKDPVTVVGDIHGQFYDLIKILDVGGPPNKTQ
jgi:serine/threonine-protein phosphatase 2B catalytic subunit